MEEDNLLIQSWFNISKDPILVVDRIENSLWIRIKENYNNNHNQFLKRKPCQLKNWFQINKVVQLFVGCYKQACDKKKKSGNSEKDIMANAYKIYSQDVGDKFNFEHA
uniref:No apical meristem-associated C-terminal domain-containing protein n=1 Tax=Cajanus cajan TaxID=3821 RepID=A0A151SXT7_CAJCA|nr:hypothetical protein KK1_015048 [Cajanus cajan]